MAEFSEKAAMDGQELTLKTKSQITKIMPQYFLDGLLEKNNFENNP